MIIIKDKAIATEKHLDRIYKVVTKSILVKTACKNIHQPQYQDSLIELLFMVLYFQKSDKKDSFANKKTYIFSIFRRISILKKHFVRL